MRVPRRKGTLFSNYFNVVNCSKSRTVPKGTETQVSWGYSFEMSYTQAEAGAGPEGGGGVLVVKGESGPHRSLKGPFGTKEVSNLAVADERTAGAYPNLWSLCTRWSL